MTNLINLKNDLSIIQQRIKECRSEYSIIKKTLTNVESALIGAKEDERKLLEQIAKIEAEQIDIDSLDDEYHADINAFRMRLIRREFWYISHAYLMGSLTFRRDGL